MSEESADSALPKSGGEWARGEVQPEPTGPADSPRVTRDAARSRAKLIAAASELFAARGYDGVTLDEIGRATGLSRGTAIYFFKTKRGLYRAVLEHTFSLASAAVREDHRTARESGLSDAEAFAQAIATYIDFLVSHPVFMRLVEREALDERVTLREVQAHLDTVLGSLEMFGDDLGSDLEPGDELAHVMLSVASMCWFPLIHRYTLLPALGFDADDAEFLKERKRHVVELALYGVSGRRHGPPDADKTDGRSAAGGNER